MIKINNLITEIEKKEILHKHLNATKNQYLMEQTNVFGTCFDRFKKGGVVDDISKENNSYKISVTWPDGNRRIIYYFFENGYYIRVKLAHFLNEPYRKDKWYCSNNQLYIKQKDKYYKIKDDFNWVEDNSFTPPISQGAPQPPPTTTVSPPPSPQTSPVSTSIFQQDNDGSFGYGSISRWVGKLQTVLNKLGKTDDQGNELKVDRKFGKKTISALKKLEDYEDFESGDEITVGEIRDIINNYKKSQEQTTQSTGPTPTRVGTQSDSTTGQSTSTPDTSTTGLEVTFDEL